jgi:hypothetical protein
LRGPSQSCRGEGNRQHPVRPERMLDLFGVGAAARSHRAVRNRRDPPRQPASGKDRAYKAGG